MLVEEIDVPVVTNSRGECFVEINRNGLLRYVRLKNVPGGLSNLARFYRHAMNSPFHEVADDLLTADVFGGLSSVDNPDSYEEESGSSDADHVAGYRSLRFQHFQVDSIDPSRPRQGILSIHYGPDDEDVPAELAIEFRVKHPNVARFLSKAHPERWITSFFDELEAATNAYAAAMVFARYARDDSWHIGLPQRFGRGMSKSAGSEFLNVLVRDPVMYQVLDLYADRAGEKILDLAHAIQENRATPSALLSDLHISDMGPNLRRLMLLHDMGL